MPMANRRIVMSQSPALNRAHHDEAGLREGSKASFSMCIEWYLIPREVAAEVAVAMKTQTCRL